MSAEIPLQDAAPLPPAESSPQLGHRAAARLESAHETGSAPHPVRWHIGLAGLVGFILAMLVLIDAIGLLMMVDSPVFIAFATIMVIHQTASVLFNRHSMWNLPTCAIMVGSPLWGIGLVAVIIAADFWLLRLAVALILLPCCAQVFARWFGGWRDIVLLKRRQHERLAAAHADPDQPIVREAIDADLADLERVLPGPNHLKRIQADRTLARYLVVEVGGQVVAFGRIVLAQLTDRPRPLLPWITNMNTRQDCRRRGFGRLLIAEMERIAREHGHAVIYIGSTADNVPAMSLYCSLGYQRIDTPPAEQRRTGHADVIYLAKRLD